jgi:Ca2+-transporting ATPase
MSLAYRVQRTLPSIRRWFRNCAAIFLRALVKYDETDGEQRAASFAYYAFFALFPLIVLIITVSTMFLGNQEFATTAITEQVKEHLPVDTDAERVIRTIQGVIRSRGRASIIALLVLIWSAVRFFQALVHGVNKAWGTKDYSWWRLPIKNFVMVCILVSALLIGTIAPVIVNYMEGAYWTNSWKVGLDFLWVIDLFRAIRILLAPLVLFYGFVMFYKFAPRRRTAFKEVWFPALFVTLGLSILQRLFVLYTGSVANFNAIYGTFGSVIALLMWIYLTGALIILGGCLAAAGYEIRMSLSDQSESNREK